MAKTEMVTRIVLSEATEFLLTEEQIYDRMGELLMLSREHLADIYRCRFELNP
jgi:hypothetical protein